MISFQKRPRCLAQIKGRRGMKPMAWYLCCGMWSHNFDRPQRWHRRDIGGIEVSLPKAAQSYLWRRLDYVYGLLPNIYS